LWGDIGGGILPVREEVGKGDVIIALRMKKRYIFLRNVASVLYIVFVGGGYVAGLSENRGLVVKFSVHLID
jgi:hypothetical protein